MVKPQPGMRSCHPGPEGIVGLLGTLLRSSTIAFLLCAGASAFAQNSETEAAAEETVETEAAPAPPPTRIMTPLPPPPPPEDDLPIPTLTIDRVPPRTSFEFAVQVSYGSVAYFQDAVPSWIGFGLRGGWGKNFGVHRIGAAATFAAEGDFGVHTLLVLEPSLTWDYVSNGGLLLGAGVGPAAMYTRRNATIVPEAGFEFAPSAVARIGWSQTWSRVGRRLFVFLEPKVRFTPEGMTPLVAIAVGSGAGR